MRATFITLSLLISTLFGQAQSPNCSAIEFYANLDQSLPSNIGKKCAVIDISASFDPKAKEFLYQWDYGDGHQGNGMITRHCYQDAGSYTATLDLIDPQTEVIIVQDLEVEVEMQPFAELDIKYPEQLMVGKAYSFAIDLSASSNLSIDQAWWSFGEGTYSCGENANYAYDLSGEKTLSLAIELVDQNDSSFILLKQVQVIVEERDYDLQLSLSPKPRFLKDKTHYAFINENNQLVESAETVTGGVKRLVLFSGNSFAEITLPDNKSDKEVLKFLNDLSSSDLDVRELPSVIFGLDQTSVSSGIQSRLNDIVTILKEYTDMKLIIGSYTHTNGVLDNNLRISEERSSSIKEYLVGQGIAEGRLLVAYPEKDRTLINTCDIGMDCQVEDNQYDRVSTFKIISI